MLAKTQSQVSADELNRCLTRLMVTSVGEQIGRSLLSLLRQAP